MTPIIHSHPCGCQHVLDPKSGVLRLRRRCSLHGRHSRPDVEHLDYLYFNFKSGNWSYFDKDGIPQNLGYHDEMCRVLKHLDVQLPKRFDWKVLEVGCGLGQYVPWLLKFGYQYTALEPAQWAANWVRNTFGVPVVNNRIETADLQTNYYDLTLAAHVLEHLDNAPESLRKLWSSLKPGGHILIVVPNDRDLFNPDHIWFFTESSLKNLLIQVGFTDVRLYTLVLPNHTHEDFIHAFATAKK